MFRRKRRVLRSRPRSDKASHGWLGSHTGSAVPPTRPTARRVFSSVEDSVVRDFSGGAWNARILNDGRHLSLFLCFLVFYWCAHNSLLLRTPTQYDVYAKPKSERNGGLAEQSRWIVKVLSLNS